MKKILFFIVCLLVLSWTNKEAHALTDVKKKDYYYDAVQWGIKQKIISGYPDGSFKPSQAVTHVQFVRMYTNVFDFEKKNMNVTGDHYNLLVQYGIHFGKVTGAEKITRGEVAALFAYANGAMKQPSVSFRKNELTYAEYNTAAKFMLDKKISSGQHKNPSLDAAKRLGYQNTVTRAQAVTFLYQLSRSKLNKVNDTVKAKKQPVRIGDISKPIRSYKMNKDVTFHITEDLGNLNIVFSYKNKVVGGYITKKGVTIEGVTIGKTDKNNAYLGEKSVVNAEPFIDNHDGKKVAALFWYYGATHTQFSKTLDFTTYDTTLVSKLYTDVANASRAKFGVEPVKEHWVLRKAAIAHSNDMQKRKYFNHDTPEGLGPSERVQAVPNNNTEIQDAGENIAAGYGFLFSAHNGWMNSMGHRMNILEPSYEFIGYGESKNGQYFTTNFY